MLTISRSIARQFRSLLRRANLLKDLRGDPAAVRFLTGPDGLTVLTAAPELAVAHHQPGRWPVGAFALPVDALAAVEGRDDSPVTFTPGGDGSSVTVRWTDRGVAQEQVVATVPLDDLPPLPPAPAHWQDSEPRLICALRDAMATRDPDSTRYALGCVQLRGIDGELCATDSRQLLIQHGLRFPWSDDLLLPGTSLFASRELQGHAVVRIGRTERPGVAVQAGPWTVWLAQAEGRFPEVRRIVPAESAITTRLQLPAADAEFLSRSLDGLPTDDAQSQPVTLDLNGAVVLRGRRGPEAPVSELELTNAQRTGSELRLNTSRRYLARALALGFRELQFAGDEAPIVCRDQHRTYLWAVLDRDSSVPATETALRSRSPVVNGSAGPAPSQPQPVNRIANRSPQTPATPVTARRSRRQRPVPTPDVVVRTLELRTQLRDVVQGLGELVRQIRQQRKQARLTKSTLAALKQLQTLEV